MSDLTGQNLGPYRIIEKIGLGGMATVYKGYQASMDRYVAIKVLPRHFAADPSFLGRFQQEAKVIARLEHARILPVYDYGEDDEITYIVMRYLQAGTLAERMENGPIPLEETSRIITQIAEGLDYAHQKGVIHRDVKPANIMLGSAGDVYITDFGISKLVEGTAQFTGSGVVGTPAYIAPEQGLGQPIDYRCDIYSLGVVLYQMVTGEVPYHAETPMAVVIKHIYEPLPLPRSVNPNLPEEVERVILRAMAKEPEHRFESCGELAEALHAAVIGLPDESHRAATSAPQDTLPYAGTPPMPETTAASPTPDDIDELTMKVGHGTPAEAIPVPDAAPRRQRRGLRGLLIAVGAVLGAAILLVAAIFVVRRIQRARDLAAEQPPEGQPPAEQSDMPEEGPLPPDEEAAHLNEVFCPGGQLVEFYDFSNGELPLGEGELPEGSVMIDLEEERTALEIPGLVNDPIIFGEKPYETSRVFIEAIFPEDARNLSVATRVSAENNRYVTVIEPHEFVAFFMRNTDPVYESQGLMNLMDNRPHLIEIHTLRDSMVLAIDGQEFMAWGDPEPLPPGRFALHVMDGPVLLLRVGVCLYEEDAESGGEVYFIEGFNGPEVLDRWEWVDDPGGWEITDDGRLAMEIFENTGPNIEGVAIGRLQALFVPTPDTPIYEVTVEVDVRPEQHYQGAGLALLGPGFRPLFTLMRARCDLPACEGEAIYFQDFSGVRDRLSDNLQTARMGGVPVEGPVVLRLLVMEGHIEAYYRLMESDWIFVGEYPLELGDERRIANVSILTSSGGLPIEPNVALFDNFIITIP